MSKHKVPRDKESGLPEKYTTGEASTDKARASHFARGKKKDPKDPSAYEPAPGDKTDKTKESQYTKKYKEMFGEDMITESADAALKKKAEKSGISLRTLKAVYKRGVAAWRTGHRPGTTPQQWGMARVNSYITKGKTYHTADKDLRESLGNEMAKSKSKRDNKRAITDTTMPTADRSISGGSKGIIESDEKIKELKSGMKRPSENPNYKSKVGLGASKNPAKGTLPWHELSKLVPANESVEHIDEARKALGKMAHTPAKPKRVKISYTAPTKHSSPKTPRKKREWNYNDEVKKLRSKFVKDIKKYKDPILRKRIKDDYMKELKTLKSVARVHKGKHPDTFFKRLLDKIGIHTEEYGAGEQGTTELVTNYKNMTPGQEDSTTSKTAKIVKRVVSEAVRRYDPVAGYRRGRPFRGGRRFKARTSGKSRQVDASKPTRTAGMLRRKMNRKAQKAMKRTMTVTARGT